MTIRRFFTHAIPLMAVCFSVVAAPTGFDPNSNASKLIGDAVSQATLSDKLVLVVFGADWCPDCRSLDLKINQTPLKKVIADNFHLVKVDVGERDNNLDLVSEYGNPIAGGIPAIAVLDRDSQVVFVSKAGELATARSADIRRLSNWFQAIVDQVNRSSGDYGQQQDPGLAHQSLAKPVNKP